MQGFITEQHLDASGYATWVQMLSGWKLWFIMRDKKAGHTSWHHFVSFQEFTTNMSPTQLKTHFDIWVLFLGPGTQLLVSNVYMWLRADCLQLDAAVSMACCIHASQRHRNRRALPRV
jgi:hypothetical protein